MPQEREYSKLPEELERELKGLFSTTAVWPAGRDGAVLAAVWRGRFERQRFWRRMGMIGIAAAVAVAAGTWWQNVSAGRPYARTGDIRDALHLARAIQAGNTIGGGWDMNRDGRVDEKDVRILAMAAVRLEKGATP